MDGKETLSLRVLRRPRGGQSLEMLTEWDEEKGSHKVAADHSQRFIIRYSMNSSLATHVEMWIIFMGRQIMPSAPISTHFFRHHLGYCKTSVHKLRDNFVRAKVSLGTLSK